MAKKVTFEEKMDKLDAIVRQLEAGELELSASLKLFSEGIRLSQQCQKELEEAQQQVSMLVQQADGSMQEQPLDTAEM